jgi:hypothetical protein
MLFIADLRVAVCFSVLNNWKRLSNVNTAEDARALHCIQGIRTLSMCLVVAGHSALFTLSAPIKNPEWLEEVSDLTEVLVLI